MSGLSSLHQKILNLCAAGYTYEEIAPSVKQSARQVRARVDEIKTQLGVNNEWGAVAYVSDRVGKAPQSRRKLKKEEIRILCYLANDYSTKEIATKMTRSEATIRQHISTIIYVTGARSRSQAVHYFHTWRAR